MKIKKIEYSEYSGAIIKAMSQGMILCSKNNDKTNVMTIGWCLIGYMWSRPIFQVAVKTSRYSYELIEESGEFTVNVPLYGVLKREMSLCGTQSGRDRDKIDLCNFSLVESQMLKTPVVENFVLFLECRIVTKTKMPIEHIGEEQAEDDPFHVMYYGEVVSSYIKA